MRAHVSWMGGLGGGGGGGVVTAHNDLWMEELISVLFLSLLNEPEWLWRRLWPLDRDNPWRPHITRNQLVCASALRLGELVHCETGAPLDRILSSASDLAGRTLIYLTQPGDPDICSRSGGRGGRGPILIQDGGDEEVHEEDGVTETQGVHNGLLQEEWPSDSLGLCRGDGLHARIPPQVAQPVHTGMDESMDGCSVRMWSIRYNRTTRGARGGLERV